MTKVYFWHRSCSTELFSILKLLPAKLSEQHLHPLSLLGGGGAEKGERAEVEEEREEEEEMEELEEKKEG